MEIMCGWNIWCLCIFWTVNVQSSFHQTTFRCSKQDVNSEERKEPVYSVFEHTLASCAVTCLRDYQCQHFMYNIRSKGCNGFKDDICGDEGNNRTARYMVYRNVCSKKCPKKTATYKITFKTGKERDSGSKADLVVSVLRSCGDFTIGIRNGKDIRLWRGHRSTFKFTRDSVCEVEGIGVVFWDTCNKDDWFIEDVVVEYEEMDTGDRHRLKFEINYWLRAADDNNNITGVACGIKSSVNGSSLELGGAYECLPLQTCGRHYNRNTSDITVHSNGFVDNNDLYNH